MSDDTQSANVREQRTTIRGAIEDHITALNRKCQQVYNDAAPNAHEMVCRLDGVYSRYKLCR